MKVSSFFNNNQRGSKDKYEGVQIQNSPSSSRSINCDDDNKIVKKKHFLSFRKQYHQRRNRNYNINRNNFCWTATNIKHSNDKKKTVAFTCSKNRARLLLLNDNKKKEKQQQRRRNKVVSKLVKFHKRCRLWCRLASPNNDALDIPPPISLLRIVMTKKKLTPCDVTLCSSGKRFGTATHHNKISMKNENKNDNFNSAVPIFGGIDNSDSYEDGDHNYHDSIYDDASSWCDTNDRFNMEVSELHSVCTLEFDDDDDENNNDLLMYSSRTFCISVLSSSQNKNAAKNEKNTVVEQFIDDSSTKYRVKFPPLTPITNINDNSLPAEPNFEYSKTYTATNDDTIIIIKPKRCSKNKRKYHFKPIQNQPHDNEGKEQECQDLFLVTAVEINIFLLLIMILNIENLYTVRSILLIIASRVGIFILNWARVAILPSQKRRKNSEKPPL